MSTVQKRLSEAAKKRVRAGRMLRKGEGFAEVALAVGVARQTVYTWKALFDKGGIDALRSVPGLSRPAELDEVQLASVRAAVLQSPTEHGFGAELWTLKRVGAVIERMHGVRTNCMFRLHEGSIKKEGVANFLKALKTHLKQLLLVIWDGLNAHRSRLLPRLSG